LPFVGVDLSLANGSIVSNEMKFLGCPTTCVNHIDVDDPPTPDTNTLLPERRQGRPRGFVNVFRALAGVPLRRTRVVRKQEQRQHSKIPIRVYPGSPRKLGERKVPQKPKRLEDAEEKPKKIKNAKKKVGKIVVGGNVLSTIDEEVNGESLN